MIISMLEVLKENGCFLVSNLLTLLCHCKDKIILIRRESAGSVCSHCTCTLFRGKMLEHPYTYMI